MRYMTEKQIVAGYEHLSGAKRQKRDVAGEVTESGEPRERRDQDVYAELMSDLHLKIHRIAMTLGVTGV